MEKYAAIKTDLSTSGLTQSQIAKKHGVTLIVVNKLNTGYLHPEVKPITPTQIKRREQAAKRIEIMSRPKTVIDCIEKEMPITVKDQASLDIVLKKINSNPDWPKTIILPLVDAKSSEFAMSVLDELKKHLELQLSVCRIKIHALETGDYSNLSEKMKEELQAAADEIVGVKESDDTPQVKYA